MKNILACILENLPAEERSVRLFHGRGKKYADFEFLSIDLFGPTLLITLYKEAPDSLISELVASMDFLKVSNVLLQKRFLKGTPTSVIKGSIPDTDYAVEDGLRFRIKFGETQNSGFFLDMYPGRKLLREIAKDKKVLNLFSYTCSLSVAALSGGAHKVINVDMSKSALKVGEINHHLNGLNDRAAFFPLDILKSWKRIEKPGPYDIVVIDPPTYQGESFKVERDYVKIVKKLDGLTANSATVLACLNTPYLSSKFLINLFLEHAPHFEMQEILYSAFSKMENDPEESLKIVVFKKKSEQ